YILLRHACHYLLARYRSARLQAISKRRPRDGKASVFGSPSNAARVRCRLGAGSVEAHYEGWENAARTVYAALPQIFGRLEDCPRPHVSGMIYFFNRTCTLAPSGKVPFKSFTTPFATTPSYSCGATLGDSRSTRPMPLSMAAFARRSASRLCSRRACSIENQSSWAINCF